MSAADHRVVVQEGAVEQDPREVRLRVRPDAEAGTAFDVASRGDEPTGYAAGPRVTDAREPASQAEDRRGTADRAADRGAGERARAADGDVQRSAQRRARQRARRDQLRGREAEQLPGLLGEQVLLEDGPRQRISLESDLAVRVERLDAPARLLLARPQVVVEASLQPVALGLQRLFVRDGDLLGVSQLVEEEIGDLPARLSPAPAPLRDERGHRLVDGTASVGAELAKGLQEPHPFVEGDGEGVEVADDLEVLVERPVPLGGVVLLADAVDQRHPRAARPAEDLHLRLVVAAERARSVDHVERVRAGEDGREELAFVEELRRPLVRAKQFRYASRPVGGGDLAGGEPGERARRILEPGCVDQHEQRAPVDANRILAHFGRGSGAGIDTDGIVLGERCDDARLALVDAPDDGEARWGRHAVPPSGSTAR